MKKPAQSTLITHSHNARDVVLGNYSWLGINLCCWTERKEKPEEHKPILKDNIRNELATRRVLQEKVFLEILQIHRKTPEACDYFKKETLAQVFSCEFCKVSKNNFFITEHLRATALDIFQCVKRTGGLQQLHGSCRQVCA